MLNFVRLCDKLWFCNILVLGWYYVTSFGLWCWLDARLIYHICCTWDLPFLVMIESFIYWNLIHHHIIWRSVILDGWRKMFMHLFFNLHILLCINVLHRVYILTTSLSTCYIDALSLNIIFLICTYLGGASFHICLK